MELSDLSNLGTKRLNALAYVGIKDIDNLVDFFPRQYLDRTSITPIQSLSGNGEKKTVWGEVKNITTTGYRRKKRLEVIIEDKSGILKGVWFKGASYIKKRFKEGDQLAFLGKINQYGRSLSIAHPDVKKIQNVQDIQNITGIIPVYPSNKFFSNTRITDRLIQQWMRVALKHANKPEFLPPSLLEKYELPKRSNAFGMIHFPESVHEYTVATKRFKFEELLLFQLSMMRIKQQIRFPKSGIPFKKMNDLTRRFFNDIIPFELTDAQKKALHDIKNDVRSGHQMNRLLQGDVGSGKTIVALGVILMALDNNCQAAFMAPTGILAEQHFRTLCKLLKPFDLNIRLLVGNQKAALRTDVLTAVESGQCQIVVGTHALIQEQVEFHHLGLAVIDEQHRFGVEQRVKILQKGSHPHLLVMSATPIPRSLAMTIYSDLDISVMDELPGGRKPVKTAIRSPKKSESVYQFVESTIEDGGQAYIVYPLVEESEKVDLKDATAGYKKLKKRFPQFSVGLLHGQMKSDKKDRIMQAFIKNKLQILVSTTVIEVGVDVPNANIMIIEHAERFGLSQLHQLRGRIGRGKRQSFCILMPGKNLSKDARFRLKKMVETNNGFTIAEADLKLRGPGNFLGTKQSGLPDFRRADILEDQQLLKAAKKEAAIILSNDPELEQDEHQRLKTVFLPYFCRRADYYEMG